MYNQHHHHHQQHQGRNNLSTSRMSIPPERHLFLQGGNGHGDTGLVLSTDAKPRLKWTAELHERFIEAVHQLGGAEKATPKTIMKHMGVPGLTLYHLKSHLQKYRLSKNLHGQASTGIDKNGYTAAVAGDRMSEVSRAIMSETCIEPHTNKNLQLSEALQMQIEVQRRLHEQLEVQRHLQLRIEAQGKYLQSVLEKAQETLGKQGVGSMGLEAAKVQISELVSKVSTECLSSAFSELHELQGLCNQPTQTTQAADCSIDSCLTSCEGSRKDQELHNIEMGLGPQGKALLHHKNGDESRLAQTEPTWFEDLNENKLFPSFMERETERMMFPIKKRCDDLSMSIRVGEKWSSSSGSLPEKKTKERDADVGLFDQVKNVRPATNVDSETMPEEFKQHYLTENLDLNANDMNDAASSCKEFDLNGFSWG